MLFLLCLIAFCQLTWVPGYLLLKLAGLRPAGRVRSIAIGFAFSLLFNYLLVYLLTVVRLYRRPVVVAVLAVEALLLLRSWLGRKGAWLEARIAQWPDRLQSFLAGRSPGENLLLILSLAMLGHWLLELAAPVGTVFTFVDTAVGWNRFALDWAANRIPTITWLYPQLLPANWSLSYLILGTSDLQLAARALMPVFPLLTVLLLLDAGVRERRSGFLLGAIFYMALLRHLFVPELLSEGLMDLPTGFFACLAFLTLRRPAAEPAEAETGRLTLAMVIGAMAAVTKQSGFLVLLLVTGWCAGRLWRRRRTAPTRSLAAAWLLVVALVAGTWFVPRLVLIHRGVERALIRETALNAHQGRTFPQRLAFGFRTLAEARGQPLGLPAWVLIGGLLAGGLACRQSRWILLLLALPYVAIWLLFYSYDARNLVPAVPFLALSAGEGGVWLAGTGGRLLRRLPPWRLPTALAAAGLALAALAIGGAFHPADRLLSSQRSQMRRLGDEKLNEKLYRYFYRQGFAGKVFSVYRYFRLLPELREYWSAERDGPGVVYWLESVNRPNREILAELQRKMASGEYQVELATGQWRLLLIRQRLSAVAPEGKGP